MSEKISEDFYTAMKPGMIWPFAQREDRHVVALDSAGNVLARFPAGEGTSKFTLNGLGAAYLNNGAALAGQVFSTGIITCIECREITGEWFYRASLVGDDPEAVVSGGTAVLEDGELVGVAIPDISTNLAITVHVGCAPYELIP